MGSETFIKVGDHMPFMWGFAIFALVLVPLSWFQLKRITPGAVIIPIACLGVSLLWLPSWLVLGFDFVAIGLGIALIQIKSKKPTNPVRLLPLLGFLPAFLPLAFQLTNPSSQQQILVSESGVSFLTNGKHASIDRGKVDITYESAWLGGGLYWGFVGPHEQSGVVSSNDVYISSRHGLMSGDAVARSLAGWSETEPRHIVNGDPRGWQAPRH